MLYQDKMTTRKILYDIFVIMTFLVISHIPVYGVDAKSLMNLFASTDILKFQDLMTGGALGRLTIGGFGITSLVTAGLVVQIAGFISPKISRLQNMGEYGKRMLDKINMVLAMVLTIIPALVLLRTDMVEVEGILKVIPFIEWVIGSFVIITLLQSVDKKGVGNGTNLALSMNILIGVAQDKNVLLSLSGQKLMIAVAVILISVLVAVSYQGAFINIKVIHTKKEASTFSATSYIPIQLATGSVLPVIYVMSIMAIPQIVLLAMKKEDLLAEFTSFVSTQAWYSLSSWENWAGFIFYVVLLFAFSFLASKMNFNVKDIAFNMRKNGDVIPGVRPGKETEKHLSDLLNKISIISPFFLVAITYVPSMILFKAGIPNFNLLGISLIILVATFNSVNLYFDGLLKHLSPKYRIFRR